MALSTHRGVLLQTWLPFGISSAPGYFQEIMDQLTSDLQGVAVYMDDILVSGTTASEHIQNLRALLKRLGFAAAWRIQFYGKFLPNLATITEPLHRLTKKGISWSWGAEEQEAFQKLKGLLCTDTILVHFNPTLPIGISCDASELCLDQLLPWLSSTNRLARWALMLSQYQYSIEYRKTSDHGNADALSRLPVGPDANFDGEEGDADVDTVYTIKTVSLQLKPTDPGTLAKESAKDPIISKLSFPRVYDLRCCSSYFGMQRMKQLAQTAVYWLGIDADIMELCHRCTACAEHQKKPPKPANHPWMLPEKPWSRVHVDHAINFLGCNWLVLIDAYSKYPCIHPTTSTSTKSTPELLEQDFAHFGYPHTIVSDNATSFSSEEFQS
ncbi:hypothetical protein EMCRGX_G017061 [Ephydatia muelleri]